MTKPIRDDEELPQIMAMDDPVLVRVVERALAPFKNVLSARKLEAFRMEALLQLSANPTAIALVRNIKGPTAARSDELDALPDNPPEPEEDGPKGTP